MEPILPPALNAAPALPSDPKSGLYFAQPISGATAEAIASPSPTQNGPSSMSPTKPATAAPDASSSSHAHTILPTKAVLDSQPKHLPSAPPNDETPVAFGAAREIAASAPSLSFESSAKPAQELVKEVETKGAQVIMGDSSAIKEGDAVSYSWGGDKKGGTVTEVATSGSVEMTTARGNTATKDAAPHDPAIRLERAGHDVVKNASEVHKEKAGETHNEGGVHKTVTSSSDDGKGKGDTNGEAQTGEKRSAEHVDEGKANGEEPAAKKKKGRPAKNGAGGGGGGAKKDVKKRPPKKAATETGEPRRSGRVAAKSS